MELTNEELMIISESLGIIIDICEAKDIDNSKLDKIRNLRNKVDNFMKGETNE